MEDDIKDKVRILQEQLELAVRQRDRFAKHFHEVCRVPHQERYEIIQECDEEIENLKYE